METYRIKHIPSGLYYCPSRKIIHKMEDIPPERVSRYIKSNLSKKGKSYSSKPNLSYIGKIYYSKDGIIMPFLEREWEIIAF
jgi:hypothetical protein